MKKKKIQEAKQRDENKGEKVHKLLLVLSGAVIGFLNGFFGGGGGMVCVPILEKVLGLDSKHSHATAIAVIFPLSLISAFIYVINGVIESPPTFDSWTWRGAGRNFGFLRSQIFASKSNKNHICTHHVCRGN